MNDAIQKELNNDGVLKLSLNRPEVLNAMNADLIICLLYTSPSPRDGLLSRMPSSA